MTDRVRTYAGSDTALEGKMEIREQLKDKKRVVIKIGSSSLTHVMTGEVDYQKMEQLTRALCDLRGMGKDVILVSSGAIAVGKMAMHMKTHPTTTSEKQALAAIGQARLMMTYQRLFAEYSQVAAQILMTKNTVKNNLNRFNARNTFEELLNMGAIPIVNENDTVATYEIEFGDNDHLSAYVAALTNADLLILLSDIDGMYTDDPSRNPDASLIPIVWELTEQYRSMGKSTSKSEIGTGGMTAKLDAAKIAVEAGIDMVIANGSNVRNILDIVEGKEVGTLFVAHRKKNFDLLNYIE